VDVGPKKKSGKAFFGEAPKEGNRAFRRKKASMDRKKAGKTGSKLMKKQKIRKKITRARRAKRPTGRVD
jgi:hypothetical protein